VKDLNIGELWSNYAYSYVNTTLADAHKNEFTMWSTNYLKKESTAEDIEAAEEQLDAQYTTKNLYRGIIKYYA
jgi:hypothetical protein